MNFKKPVVQHGSKGNTEEIFSIGIIEKKGELIAHVLRVNKAFYDNRNAKKLAFSIEPGKTIVVCNPSGDIPSYNININGGKTSGENYTISNKDLCKDILVNLNVPYRKGSVYFTLVPMTKYSGLETFELKLKED